MPQRDPGVYLEDIEYYADAAVRFVRGYSLEQYLSDEKTRAAVERVLEICGEAMNGLYRKDRVSLRAGIMARGDEHRVTRALKASVSLNTVGSESRLRDAQRREKDWLNLQRQQNQADQRP